MVLKYAILVAFGHKVVSLVTAAEHVCSTYSTQYGGDVYFCDSEQVCCDSGCCYSTNYAKYLWVLLIGILLLVLGSYFCSKYCCQKSNSDSGLVVINTRPIASPEFELPTSRPRGGGDAGHLQTLFIPTAPPNHYHQGAENTHPITPPPAYELAINSPLHGDHRVPSYEDVMAAAKNKNT